MRCAIRRGVLVSALAAMLLASAACASDDRRALPTTPSPAPAPSVIIEPITTLLFTGDIIPARCTYARLRDLGDYGAAFDALRADLTAADITIGTLDATISSVAEPYGCVETFSLAGPAAMADALRDAGFDVLSHAANHVKDCGAIDCGDAAFFETHALLEGARIAHPGAGRNLAAARAPSVIVRNGVSFAFLAYDDIAPWYHATADAPGSAPLDTATIAEDIANAKKVAQVVIVLPQWGIEYTASPSARQREVARAVAAAGADVVAGNHPHWVQAHEQVGETFVAYALGNFVFDQDWSVETQQGAMLELTFTGTRLTAWRYIPVQIAEQYQPRPVAPEEAAAILQRIEDASAGLLAR